MPRQARLNVPGFFHHVMARGIEGREIFRDEADRENFLDRLGDILARPGAPRLYAWALMTNHFHLLVQPTDLPLSAMLRRLLTGHAVRFNIRHQRTGHLFQNRYKSIVVEDEAYFLELVRYIHLNPVRVGAVTSMDELESYPYTGHAVVLGKRLQEGQDVDSVLSRFSARRSSADSAYRKFVSDGFAQGRRQGLGTGGLARGAVENSTEHWGGRILGRNEFAETVVGVKAVEKVSRRAIEEVLTEVSERTGVSAVEILGPGRGRQASSARGAFFRQAQQEAGATFSALGRMTGRTHVAVIKAIQKQVT